MAIGPHEAGEHYAPSARVYQDVQRSLEKMIDDRLKRHPPGRVLEMQFPRQEIFGVVLQGLVAHYQGVGWSRARVEPDASDHYRLILEP